jgi:asparagine synthetase B (glutamine-hydrolysing)
LTIKNITNELGIVIDKKKKYKTYIDKEKLLLDFIYLKIKRIKINNNINNYLYDNKLGIISGFLGYITNLSDLTEKYRINKKNCDIETFVNIYLKKGIEAFKELEGVFTIFIFDLKNKKGYLFQDEYGSNNLLLYTINENGLFFSNSLKVLLKESLIKRNINIEAARNFLYNKTIIPNKKTLIQGISKLMPGEIILFNLKDRTATIDKIDRVGRKFKRKKARNILIDSIKLEITKLINIVDEKKIGIALSSGYDSNLTLHFLNKIYPGKIIATTIGGKIVNEIPNALKCSSRYSDINHLTRKVKEDSLSDFPEIVWRTEGNVFEVGLFLQNELMRLLSENDVNFSFFSECADQQLNPYRSNFLAKERKRFKKLKIFRKFNPEIYDKRIIYNNYDFIIRKLKKPKQSKLYDSKKDYILKKNGILSNSYGIQGAYPFLARDIQNISKSLGRNNCYKKKFYRKKVEEIINPKIRVLLNKIGGATDVIYLFSGKEKIFKKILYSELFKNIIPFLSKKKIDYIIKNYFLYTDFLGHVLYIHLFNDLFVSGDYDNLFSRNIDQKIEHFFK